MQTPLQTQSPTSEVALIVLARRQSIAQFGSLRGSLRHPISQSGNLQFGSRQSRGKARRGKGKGKGKDKGAKGGNNYNTSSGKGGGRAHVKGRTSDNRMICFAFNTSQGCAGSCNMVHVCSTCESDKHAAFSPDCSGAGWQ